MPSVSVDLSRLDDPRIVNHIAGVDSRIVGGFRLALEVLGIPIPQYARRKPAGRPSVAALMAAADKDTGTNRTYRDEKRRIRAFAPKIAG